jgi:hypothetical protein
LKDEAKPFCISRREVWEAYLKVKSNKGPRGGGALVPAARAVNKTALLRRARETLWAECQHSRLKPLPLKCPHKPETLSVSEFRPIRRNSETVRDLFLAPQSGRVSNSSQPSRLNPTGLRRPLSASKRHGINRMKLGAHHSAPVSLAMTEPNGNLCSPVVRVESPSGGRGLRKTSTKPGQERAARREAAIPRWWAALKGGKQWRDGSRESPGRIINGGARFSF